MFPIEVATGRAYPISHRSKYHIKLVSYQIISRSTCVVFPHLNYSSQVIYTIPFYSMPIIAITSSYLLLVRPIPVIKLYPTISQLNPLILCLVGCKSDIYFYILMISPLCPILISKLSSHMSQKTSHDLT